MKIRSTWLWCEWAKPPQKSSGGIWLPEIAQSNLCHAIVLEAGDGRLSGGGRCALQGEKGAHVIFPKHLAIPVKEKTLQVRDEDLIALVYEGEDGQPVLTPANDYLLIERDRADIVTRGGLILPEISRRRAQRGVIRDYGPGEVRTTGPLAGSRRTVLEILNTPMVDDLIGLECLWTDRAAAVQVTSAGSACWLLPAGKLDLLEQD